MSDPLDVQVVGLAEALAKIKRVAPNIVAALNKAMQTATLDLVGHVKAEKLSGQVLGNRTGTLRRSITQRVEDDGATLRGLVGTNVPYGRFWEKGYTGKMPVKAHERNVTTAWGKPLDEPRKIAVRAHERKLDVKPRPFLRPAIEERYPAYERMFIKAIQEGAGGTQP